MKRLIEIIDDLRKVRESSQIMVLDDKTIFEQACSFRRGELARDNKTKDFKREKKKKSKKYEPTEKQLNKWKDEDVTDSQRNVLIKMGLKDNEIKNMSKLEAYQTINSCKKENI